MTVCRYFLQNTCRFGDNCRFEHPRGGGAQQNLFGTGGSTNWQGGGQKVTFRDSFGGGGGQFQPNNNQFKWTANQPQQPTSTASQPVSAMDIVNALPKEMDTWEKSKMWPFSCVSVEKDLACLPDFYDMSVEEMRLEAYQAVAASNIQAYAQKLQTLVTEFQNKRMQLKNMSMDVKGQLASFIEEARKKKTSSSTLSATPTMNSTTQGSQSLFGSSTTASPSPSPGLFGQSSTASSNTLFGSSATNSTFGGNSTAVGSSFDGNSSSMGSTFGNSGNAPGLFGKPQPSSGTFNSQGQGQSSSLFGNQSKPSLFGGAGGSPMSGSTTNSDGLFGRGISQPSPGLFSNTGSSFSNPAAPAGLFGNTANNAPNVFGGNSEANPSAAANTSGMFAGGNSASTPSTGLFGKAQPSPGLFGKPAQTSAPPATSGLFGQSPGLQTANVNPQSSTILGGTSVVSNPGTEIRKGIHSALEDLSQQEIAAFKASAFTLGKIPLKPPPLELVNI